MTFSEITPQIRHLCHAVPSVQPILHRKGERNKADVHAEGGFIVKLVGMAPSPATGRNSEEGCSRF